ARAPRRGTAGPGSRPGCGRSPATGRRPARATRAHLHRCRRRPGRSDSPAHPTSGPCGPSRTHGLVRREVALAQLVAEAVLLDLARRRPRELVEDEELLGPLLAGQPGGVEVRADGVEVGWGGAVDEAEHGRG